MFAIYNFGTMIFISTVCLMLVTLTFGSVCDDFPWHKWKPTSVESIPQPTRCETDWELYEGLCYKFVVCPNNVCTGDAAKAECNSFGGQLARVKSGGHHNLFVSKLSGKHFWIGGNDRDTEGLWVWENGIHIVNGWTNWYNAGAGGPVYADFDCLYSNNNWAGNKWDDFPCYNQLHAYVCEKPATF